MKHKIKRMMMVILFCLAGLVCQGQDFGMMNRYRTAKVRVSVVDGKTGNPVDYATVYLCHQGDTVITNFALTDGDGLAVIEDVTQGKYDLNVELLGYVPVKKQVDIKLGDFEREQNLGKIQLEQSREFLNAASVSAAGNPVVVKKDTLVFNANAYRTVENAMLADILKKMPGVKVGSDGSIKVNGEKVDRLTVGGKTFSRKTRDLLSRAFQPRLWKRFKSSTRRRMTPNSRASGRRKTRRR